VYLLYDSDAAGLKATFRAGDELLRQGMSVRVITLPPGEDPDTFVRAQGSAGLEAQIQASIDVFDRKIQILERAGWFGELQKKRRALDRLLPTIRATSDEIMRDLYVVRASEVTGVDREILNRELGTRQAAQEVETPRAQAPQRPTIRGRTSDRRETRRNAGSSAERELIRAMVNDRSRVEPIAERIGPDAFRHPVYRRIFSTLLESGEDTRIEQLSEVLDPEAIELIQEMLGEGEALINTQRTIDDSITRLHVRDMEERLAEIDGLVPLANDIEKVELSEEREKLVIQMRASGKMTFKAFRPGRAR
jgi:DNA primase